MSVYKNNIKNKKLLQNIIVRKRLNAANLYHKNITSNEEIKYIICIPINGFTSDVIQLIRTDLNKYDFISSKYTKKLFISLLKNLNIKITESALSQFYLGQMLVLKLNIIIKDYRKNQNKQVEILTFLDKYLSNIKYCNLVYITTNNNDSKSLIVTNFINKFKDEFNTMFHNKNIYFPGLNNNIISFLTILNYQIILLLKLLILIKDKQIL